MLFPSNEASQAFGPTHEDAEIEVLQTDVMRFMAILGFILSVIFALVQSLPFIPKDLHPTLEHYQSLQTDIANLKRHIESQLAYLDEIKEQISELEALKHETMSEIESFKKTSEALISDSRKASDDLKNSQQTMAGLEDQLRKQKTSLSTLRLKVDKERRELKKVRGQLVDLKKSVFALKQQQNAQISAAKTVKNKPVNNPKTQETSVRLPQPKPPEKEKISVTEPENTPKRVGFTLKFESDEAFDRLLATKSIDFFVFVGSQSWRVELQGNKPRFSKVTKPKRYHEMDSITVPMKYGNGFKQVVAAHGRASRSWGVVLPPSITASIQRKITNKKGGDVSIDRIGRVRLENPNPERP